MQTNHYAEITSTDPLVTALVPTCLPATPPQNAAQHHLYRCAFRLTTVGKSDEVEQSGIDMDVDQGTCLL